jgi:hypothetical protein
MSNLNDAASPKSDALWPTHSKQSPLTRLATFATMFAGLFLLCAAVSMIQGRAMDSADKITMRVSLENWGPPILVTFFGIGWTTFHILGVALLYKRKIVAIAAIMAYVVAGIVIPSLMFLAREESLLKELSVIGMAMVGAGGLLRQSAFQPEVRSEWRRWFIK